MQHTAHLHTGNTRGNKSRWFYQLFNFLGHLPATTSTIVHALSDNARSTFLHSFPLVLVSSCSNARRKECFLSLQSYASLHEIHLRVFVSPSHAPETPRNALMKTPIKAKACRSNSQGYSHSLAVLLLYPAELLLDVHARHLFHASVVLGRVWLSVIRQSCPLPPCLFLW
jgi:hypothetical protein